MGAAGQVHRLWCATCGHTGASIWRLHAGPRRLRDLEDFSEGFRCVDGGPPDGPQFWCAACARLATESPSDRPLAEALKSIWTPPADPLPLEPADAEAS